MSVEPHFIEIKSKEDVNPDSLGLGPSFPYHFTIGDVRLLVVKPTIRLKKGLYRLTVILPEEWEGYVNA